MLEGELGVNYEAASAANHSEACHNCKLSCLQMEQSKCQRGFPSEGEMAVRINFQGDDKQSGTWCYLN